MKRIILILILGAMAPAGLYAQKVYLKNGMAILDMTVAAGMPAGAVTDELKTPIYDLYEPQLESNIPDNFVNEKLNATVYRKLEISLEEPGGMTWINAYNHCKNSVEGGKTDWRLPTQRELLMIWIFRDALDDVIVNDLSGASFSPTTYYSSTERNTSKDVWYHGFGLTGTLNWTSEGASKNHTHRVRCVREVVD